MVSEPQDSRFLVKRGLVRRIVRTFRPYSSKVTAVGLLIVVTAGLGVVNPLLIRIVFDSALFPPSGTPDLGLLWLLAGIMATITVFTGSLGVVQTYLTNHVGPKGHERPSGSALPAPTKPVTWLLYRHPHGRSPVPHSERRRWGPNGGNRHCIQRHFKQRHLPKPRWRPC